MVIELTAQNSPLDVKVWCFFVLGLCIFSVLIENSMILFCADSTRSTTQTLNTNWRFNINNHFRINPRLRMDYRKSKLNSDDRWMLRPLIGLDYQYERWLQFEMDLGMNG